MERFNGFVRGFVLLALAGLLAGCAETQQARSAKQSGFLGDYSMLREGKSGEALLIYKNPSADWKSYKKVMLDPVTIWAGPKSPLKDVSVEDRRRLADLLWNKLYQSLKADYEIVSEPGPGTIRFQVAITEAEESNAALDTVSSVVPQLRTVTSAKGLATGVAGFTGSASAELKVTDASSGELLVAAVDRRGGTKSMSGVTNSWDDVEKSYAYWAEKMRYRLCQWRGGANCVEPKA